MVRKRSDAVYVDASVWCAYCFNQRESAGALRWLSEVDLTLVGTAWWTETEFASALGIQVRKKALNLAQAKRARALFEDLMGIAHRLNVIEADFMQAAQWTAQANLGLRGGDALHLAVAQRHGCTVLASLDNKMCECAKALGLKMVDLK